MALSDSMFLFEIIVDELQSRTKCKSEDFIIRCQFGEIFQLFLKNPNVLNEDGKKNIPKKKFIKKHKVRECKSKSDKSSTEARAIVGQTVLIASTMHSLFESMNNYPLQISLSSKNNTNVLHGAVEIPWKYDFCNKFLEMCKNMESSSIVVETEQKLFNEVSSKLIANMKLKIKLRSLHDKIVTQYRTPLEHSEGARVKNGNLSSIHKVEKRNIHNETGTIKTTYAGRQSRARSIVSKKKSKISKIASSKKEKVPNECLKAVDTKPNPINNRIVDLIRSDTDIEVNKKISLSKSKSLASLKTNHLNALKYIFGDPTGPFGNQVYYVGYFTVKSDTASPEPSKVAEVVVTASRSSLKIEEKFKFKLCDSECPIKCSPSHCSIDMPQDGPLVRVSKCNRPDCYVKEQREPPSPPDDAIKIDVSKRECCDFSEKIEQIVGDIKAKMKVGNDPCYCTCECTFGFTKKTTYCKVCGGYEFVGDEFTQKPGEEVMPFPCPIYHKLVDKNKLKTCSSGSDSKKNPDNLRKSKGDKKPGDKNDESEKDSKKGKKKKKDDRFKFNYGYQGIPPQIGHSQCAMPCTGTLGAVPKNMGWLWTAEDIPGLRFRPLWRPGATNKHVVRLLRMARNPGEIIAKKRRKEVKKKPLKRPLLIVHKKDGEYTVTMETMKPYCKPRAINQQPYEDKPLVTYTIGRSEEENRERRLKKERAHRRLERAQRDFIQSAFKDVCKEICLKTYQQALGFLPDTEDPECTCYPAEPGPDRTNVDVSCSCSEVSGSIGSDTDSDEWVVEFTPPNAFFDPTYKGKKLIKVDNGSQYTYLDYRVKIVDRFGNPVPRFFIGPDGKQQCSDLGGFWSPNRQWLEINVEGQIALDGRWAPHNFIGPNGEQVEAEIGKFQAMNGKWLIVGVDGYVDGQGKWRFYSKPRGSPRQVTPRTPPKKGNKKGDSKSPPVPPSEATWSCFGDASPTDLSKMGIVGHGEDRKLLISTLKAMLARGEDVRIPQPSKVPRRPESKKGKRVRTPGRVDVENELWTQCRHSTPSSKGIMAVDDQGNKVYFKMKDFKNRRPKERLTNLSKQGVSVSSFHIPCFHSFINSEVMKQQQKERLLGMVHGKNVATQA